MTGKPSFPVIASAPIGERVVQTVNARDLHAFLQVGKDFSNWMKDRIEQYGFVENTDYVVFAEIGKNPQGGRPAKEYALTIDMAKELSMVERNEQGKKARQYFIECERRALDPSLALMLDNVEKVIALEGRVAELQPAKEALDRIASGDGSLCITDAAKSLQMRPKDLFNWLRQNGWIYRRPGSGHDLGYQSKTTAGLLEHKITTVLRTDGTEKVTEQVRITAKGLTKLATLIKPAIARVA